MITIIRGSDRQANNPFIVRLRDANGDPIDLGLYSQISTCFKNTTGADLVKTLTGGGIVIVGDAKIGKLRINLTAAETALLKLVTGETLQIDLTLTAGGLIDPIQIKSAYSVIADRC